MDTLRPVFEGAVVKVTHDCREDASALLSQFDVQLANVFDVQVAHTMLQEQEASRPYQISLNELLKKTLKLENEGQHPMAERMKEDPNLWFYRPLPEEMLSYAVQDAMYLPLLHWRLCSALGDPSGGSVLQRSQQYVDYASMNMHLQSPKAVERRGLRLQAMLATRTKDTLYFKLNLGSRQGAASRPDAVSRFKGLKFGEMVDCWVSAWNATGAVVFLEKHEAGSMYPEPPGRHERRQSRWTRSRNRF